MPIGAFLGGAGKAAAEIADKYISSNLIEEQRRQEEMRDRRAAEYREQIRRSGGEYDAEQSNVRRRAQANELQTAAEAEAGKRGGLLSSDARGAYLNSGMSEEDVNAGMGAVDDAEKAGRYKQDVTTKDYEAAGLKTGLLGVKDKIGMDRADKKDVRDDAKAELQSRIQTWREADSEAKRANEARRIDAMFARMGGGDGKKPTQVQQIEYLTKEHGLSQQEARSLVYHPEGKVGEYDSEVKTSYDDDGNEIKTTTKRKAGGPKTGGGARLDGLPSGAKKIGTSGGKAVYQTPDGKKFIQE